MITPSLDKDRRFLKKTISDLTEQLDLLTMLQDMSKRVISQFNSNHISVLLLDVVEELVGYRLCVLYLYDENSQTYEINACRGISSKEVSRYSLDYDIVSWILKERRWTQTHLFKDGPPNNDLSYSALPLSGVNRTLGFLLMASDDRDETYTPANTKLLTFIASQAGIALENEDLYSRLNRSNEYINNILESINNGIITIDMGGRITQINKNATAMLRLKTADVIGTPYADILSQDVAKMIRNEMDKALRDKVTFEMLFDYCPEDNQCLHLGVNSSLLIDEEGTHIGVIIVLRDVSASKELQRLREVDELKSQFVSNVSHELRSPLGIIKSYVEALLDQVDTTDHETQQEFLSIVNSETDRLTAMVTDLLDISRIESGRIELQLEATSVVDVIAMALERIEKNEKHEIAVRAPEKLPLVMASREKLVQVFMNLVTNAIKFSPDGGPITIHVRDAEPGYLRVTVSDTGVGISEKDKRQIFEPFFRGEISDHDIPGTGLGLSIVKRIVEAHRGDISVETAPGKGSAFTIRLPLEATDLAAGDGGG